MVFHSNYICWGIFSYSIVYHAMTMKFMTSYMMVFPAKMRVFPPKMIVFPPPNLMVFPPKKISPSFQFVGLLGRNDVGGGDCFGHGGGRGHGHLVKWRHGGKPTKSEQPRGQGRV